MKSWLVPLTDFIYHLFAVACWWCQGHLSWWWCHQWTRPGEWLQQLKLLPGSWWRDTRTILPPLWSEGRSEIQTLPVILIGPIHNCSYDMTLCHRRLNKCLFQMFYLCVQHISSISLIFWAFCNCFTHLIMMPQVSGSWLQPLREHLHLVMLLHLTNINTDIWKMFHSHRREFVPSCIKTTSSSANPNPVCCVVMTTTLMEHIDLMYIVWDILQTGRQAGRQAGRQTSQD